jgi:hypothetical protein
MKIALALFALACVSVACEKKAAENTPAADSATLPMEVSYKGTPEIGNLKNVQTVMECNKRISEMNMDLGEFFADTLTMHFADGMETTLSRDSSVAFLSAFTGQMSKINIAYTAVLPINMVDQKHEWVFSWTEETYTMKDGTVGHQFLHEDYRMENGKIREVFQYSRNPRSAVVAVK